MRYRGHTQGSDANNKNSNVLLLNINDLDTLGYVHGCLIISSAK
jgi:hypothetical protein